MGLNVYFCDVCGVRVTDVDLRSGHGMLRHHDVICATCLDMGHGKEWLAARGGEAALSASKAQASSKRPSSSNGVAMMLDHARDRAVTVEDDDDRDTRLADDAEAALAARHHDHDDTRLNESVPADFSGAAAGFAALSQTPAHVHTDDADGDVSEVSTDEVDPALLRASSGLVPAISTPIKPSREEHQASPFTAPVDDDESSALINVNASRPSRSSSRSSSAKGASDSRAAAATGSARTSSAGNRAAGKKSSSSTTAAKSSKSSSKTARSGRRGPGGGMPIQLKIALITVPLILLIAIVIIVNRLPSAKAGDVKDLVAQKSQISKNFREAETLINEAWSSKNVAQMKAADQRWKEFMQEWERFSGDAKTYSKWTDDNCNDYWDSLRAADVYARTRLLRDEIVKQSAH